MTTDEFEAIRERFKALQSEVYPDVETTILFRVSENGETECHGNVSTLSMLSLFEMVKALKGKIPEPVAVPINAEICTPGPGEWERISPDSYACKKCGFVANWQDLEPHPIAPADTERNLENV